MNGAPTSRRDAVSEADVTRKRNLRVLLAGITSVVPPDLEITDLTLDSRRVTPGSAFCALPGTLTHGLAFAQQAIAAGAATSPA